MNGLDKAVAEMGVCEEKARAEETLMVNGDGMGTLPGRTTGEAVGWPSLGGGGGRTMEGGLGGYCVCPGECSGRLLKR